MHHDFLHICTQLHTAGAIFIMFLTLKCHTNAQNVAIEQEQRKVVERRLSGYKKLSLSWDCWGVESFETDSEHHV